MSSEKVFYRLEANPNAKGADDSFILQAYNGCGWSQNIYVGNVEKCGHLAANGNVGAMTTDDFVSVITACVSYFYDESGTQLTALVTPDHKVYLGRRDDYDNHGHYFQKNYPLIFVSENEDVLDLIAGNEGPYSRREMQKTNAFALGELGAFLQLGLYTRL